MTSMTLNQQKFYASIPESWKAPLENVCQTKEIDNLVKFLKDRETAGAIIYPPKEKIFASLKATSFDNTKIVIVGQDPYHGAGQANGLCFSVQEGIPFPPSLKNIFKELHNDLKIPIPKSGNLMGWAKQGVILLNSILTVEDGKPASHAGHGWELFTDVIIEKLIKRQEILVLLLWGAYAQKKIQNLHMHFDSKRHLILKAKDTSPLSAHSGFFNQHHFSKTNEFLKEHNVKEIDWANL